MKPKQIVERKNMKLEIEFVKKEKAKEVKEKDLPSDLPWGTVIRYTDGVVAVKGHSESVFLLTYGSCGFWGGVAIAYADKTNYTIIGRLVGIKVEEM